MFNVSTPSFLTKIKNVSNQAGSLIKSATTSIASVLSKSANTKALRQSQIQSADASSAAKAQSFSKSANTTITSPTKSLSLGGLSDPAGAPAVASLESSFPGFPAQHTAMGSAIGVSITTALVPVLSALSVLGAAVAAAQAAANAASSTANQALSTSNQALSTANNALTVANSKTTTTTTPTTNQPTGSNSPATLPIGNIIINPASANIVYPNTVQLAAVVTDVSGSVVKAQLTWGTFNQQVATVDQTGLVTAAFPGSTIITVDANYNGSLKGTISSVTVQPNPTVVAPSTGSDTGPTGPVGPPGNNGGNNNGGSPNNLNLTSDI